MSRFEEFITSPFFKYLFNLLPIVSFIIANLGIFLIFNYFLNKQPLMSFQFQYTLNPFVLYLIVGLFLSFIILKTTYFFKFQKKPELSFPLESQDTVGKKEPEVPKTKKRHSIFFFWNVMLVGLRFLFFNLLNDLFILTIFWISLFFLLYFIPFTFGLIILPPNFNFSNFVSVFTLIGIVSGFFQIYVSSHKETVTKKVNEVMGKFVQKSMNTISFSDFYEYVNRKDMTFATQKIKPLLEEEDNIMKQIIKAVSTGEHLRGKFHLNIFSPHDFNSIQKFEILEYTLKAKPNLDEFNKLNQFYQQYFLLKYEEYKKDLDKKDMEDFQDIKKIILTNITFFDELFTDYSKINFELPNKDDEITGFFEHLNIHIYDCVFYTCDLILELQ